tara:strand:+ start:1006 stop:1218 length:213 start_codon:yes stop_codon:yes gene_type:complete
MYFNNIGLIERICSNGDICYTPWKHVHGIYDWVVNHNKDYIYYPAFVFTREQVGFILAHYEDVSKGLHKE